VSRYARYALEVSLRGGLEFYFCSSREKNKANKEERERRVASANFSAARIHGIAARLSMRAMRRDFIPIARNVSMKLNVLPFRGFAGAFNIYNAVTYVNRARAQKLNNVHLRALDPADPRGDGNTAMYANAFLSSFIRSRLRR